MAFREFVALDAELFRKKISARRQQEIETANTATPPECRMPCGGRIVRLSTCRGELGVRDDEKEATSVRKIGARLSRFFPAIFWEGGAGERESPGSPRRIWDVFRFVQTILDRQLFPVGPLTNHFVLFVTSKSELE